MGMVYTEIVSGLHKKEVKGEQARHRSNKGRSGSEEQGAGNGRYQVDKHKRPGVNERLKRKIYHRNRGDHAEGNGIFLRRKGGPLGGLFSGTGQFLVRGRHKVDIEV